MCIDRQPIIPLGFTFGIFPTKPQRKDLRLAFSPGKRKSSAPEQ
jgi:hypothetical protein